MMIVTTRGYSQWLIMTIQRSLWHLVAMMNCDYDEFEAICNGDYDFTREYDRWWLWHLESVLSDGYDSSRDDDRQWFWPIFYQRIGWVRNRMRVGGETGRWESWTRRLSDILTPPFWIGPCPSFSTYSLLLFLSRFRNRSSFGNWIQPYLINEDRLEIVLTEYPLRIS